MVETVAIVDSSICMYPDDQYHERYGPQLTVFIRGFKLEKTVYCVPVLDLGAGRMLQ